MDKIELIDRAAVIADLKKQFAAVYKDTMLHPIMDDDPFIEVLAKSEGQHMRSFLDWLEAYLMTRPTIDAAPVRRGEWLEVNPIFKGVYQCSACGTYIGMTTRALTEKRKDNYCSECGADMRTARDPVTGEWREEQDES